MILQTGKTQVYIVGAGPGDPELITLKGKKAIQKAGVLIYDNLIDKRLLQYTSPSCEIIYAGKISGAHTLTQEEINTLLIEKAQNGSIVVRLKGGDPFVFGRGAEEAEALVQANIQFEIIPGITSAIAAPAYAGIPVTHRDLTSMFTVITGHEDPTKESSSINWEHLAHLNTTLVFLMGIKNLDHIVHQLIQHGKDPLTPSAVIRYGTHTHQTVLTETLENLASAVRKVNMTPPCITIIGDVVNLRQSINWYEQQPLFNKNVVVTRAREQASEFSTLLQESAAHVIEFPTIKIIPPENYDLLDSEIYRLASYDWVIFTSLNGVKIFFERLDVLGLDARNFHGTKICTIGTATANQLKSYGLIADCIPDEFVAESIIEKLQERNDIAGKKFLLPRADIARQTLPDELIKRGGTVTQVHLYTTTPDYDNLDIIQNLLKDKKIDLLTFTSSSTVRNFLAAFDQSHLDVKELCKTIIIASIGPITTSTIIDLLGKTPEIQPKEHTILSLYNEIISFYSQNNRLNHQNEDTLCQTQLH